MRDQLSKRLSRIKVKLRNGHFTLFFPEMEGLYTDILHTEVICILEYFPTSYDIRQTSFSKFSELLQSGRSTQQQKHRIYTIWHLAQTSISCPPMEATYMEVRHLLTEIKLLKKQIKEVDQSIKEVCQQSDDYHLLLSIPGFGPMLSALFLAHVGSVHSYRHSGQLTKLAGLDLEYCQSGKFFSKARISKKGSSLLRYGLYLAAVKSLSNHSIKSYFQDKILLRDGSPACRAKLRIKLTEKMLRTAYTILKTKQPFNIDKFLSGESILSNRT